MEKFLNSPAGQSWPGGPNLKVAQQIFAQNPELLEYEDKVQALTEVYEYMKANGLVQKNPEIEAATKQREAIESATSLEEIRAALNSEFYRNPLASVWGGQ